MEEVVEEVVEVPPLPDFTMTEYMLQHPPLALPPRVMVPAGKARTNRLRVASEVTRFVPVSVKVLSHEGFDVIRSPWATYTDTGSLTVKLRKFELVAALSLLAVWI